jgi:hypothetical protein
VTVPDSGETLAIRLGGGAIAAALDEASLILIPDPDAPGRRGRLDRLLEGVPAALGPTVRPVSTNRSVARAALAFRLMSAGAFAADDLVIAEDAWRS